MRITDLEAYTVALPFQAPITSSFGISYPARVRTFIRLHTDEGFIGHGETGINPLHYFDRTAQLKRFETTIKSAVVGEDPFNHAWLRRKLFYHPDAIAIEIACWDIVAQAAGVPLYRLLGGEQDCERVPIAGYCFFRAPDQHGEGSITLENFVENCVALKEKYGFSVLKLKLGANPPQDEIPVIRQVRETVGHKIDLRIDPNGSWSLGTALRTIHQLADVDLQYVEEPIRGLGPADSTTATNGLRRLRESTATPIAADHCYRIDLLTQIIRADVADIVLADLFGCGGIAETMLFAEMARAFDLGLALHSGAETCIGQAAKVHIHAALNQHFNYAGDAIYPEYVDGVLAGGKLRIHDGHMDVPQGPGLGVQFDDSKLEQWELTESRHRELDDFWDERKADIGVDYPGIDLLMRHY